MAGAEGRSAAARAEQSDRYGPHSALIVVDVQNDFADPAGSLSVPGGRDVVDVINREVALALESGGIVAYTQDWHPAHTPHFAQDGGVWPVHCVQGTWGADLTPGLDVRGPVVRKGSHGEDGYSGFTMRDPETADTVPTELEPLLVQSGITNIVVCGLATDYCVKATALDGVRLGYTTSVLLPAIRAVNLQPSDGEQAIAEMAADDVQLLETAGVE